VDKEKEAKRKTLQAIEGLPAIYRQIAGSPVCHF
jgi:hypothetical protein